MNAETIISIKHDGNRDTRFCLTGCITGRTSRKGGRNISNPPKRDYSRDAQSCQNNKLHTVILSETEFLVVDKPHREVRLFHRVDKKNVYIRSMLI